MTTYVAPTRDMLFAMNELAGLAEIAALPGNEEVTPDLVEAIGSIEQHYAAHGIAHASGLFENRALPRIGFELLALLDAQRFQHAHVEEVARMHGVVVDNRRETLPECHPHGRGRIHDLPRHGDEPVGLGTAAFAQRIDLDLLDVCDGGVLVAFCTMPRTMIL